MWNALESYYDDEKDARVVRPDHPVPPSATLREIAAWMTYIHTKRTSTGFFYGLTTYDRVDECDLHRYIVKTDYHLRAIGIW